MVFIRNSVWLYILFVANIAVLLCTDTTSIISYVYALFLLVVSGYLLCRKEMKDLLFTYHFYLLFAIIFTVIFKIQFPSYLGMNGGDAMMDDSRFYAQIVDWSVGYDIAYKFGMMPFSLLLKTIYPFTVHTPLNIIVICVIFTAFLPIFVRRLSCLLTNNIKIANLSFVYSLICPFTLYFGCILLRESFTVVMVLAGLCYFIQKKYLPLVVCFAALVWVRFGTLAFLFCGILLLYKYRLKFKTRTGIYFNLLLFGIIIAFYFSFSFLQEFSNGKLEYGLIRSTEGARYEDTTIGALMNYPFPLNIIFSTVFFIFIPIFSFPHLQFGHYLIGGIFQGFLTPLFMFFLWKPIFNASISALFDKNNVIAKKLFYMALLFALLLGTISMQSRHKTVLFPVLCILAAYGSVNNNIKYENISTIMAAIVIVSEIAIAFINLH